ncbi:GNAT family N-acetyltransferase [Lacibacter luteus]|uniref:GNAT family N-acetyltransferase n=1 Tax=Lacibacter luteus TaxID=2508719 RepID=A0A4Q1CMW3_9BACT|nr:GNAT family N-acetyltransferase [Lacibacter luteus]RXK62428.1 GNAT family N-acetyltransferase [Lacibacter luteus]
MEGINYIPYASINKQKWNDCIDRAVNGLIYGYAWYLDAMAEQWDALVLNDYEAVMPIASNKKYGISYLYQPYFCASLGIFSVQPLTGAVTESFLKSIPSRFRYIDIYLNKDNLFPVNDFPLTERMNFVLPLNKPYSVLAESYRSNLKRNIKKAEQSKLLASQTVELDAILALAKETMQRVSAITDEQLNRFKKVFEEAKKFQQAETMGIYTANGDLLASAVFLYSHNRWYYILVGNHPNGKTLGASHYLIDRFIALHADTDSLLDFEGSDIRNLAFFYSSYGAEEERYAALRMNRLPKLLRWLKE